MDPIGPASALSIKIFRRYITTKQLLNGTVYVDASQIVSKDCYEDWLNSRRGTPPQDPPKRFQRYLTCHLTGSDGRASYPHKNNIYIAN